MWFYEGKLTLGQQKFEVNLETLTRAEKAMERLGFTII